MMEFASTRASATTNRAPRTRLRVATWNVHGAVGGDGAYAPSRIASVLTELDADVVALQEVGSRSTHDDLLAHLAASTGYRVINGPLVDRDGHSFGNAVLSRLPVRQVAHLDLAVDHHEPRGAIDLVVEAGRATSVRVLATHLGLRPGERREQVRRLLAAVERAPPGPTVLMGDVNEWYLWGRPLRWLHAHFRERPAAPLTFPARRPVLALDRIWVAPRGSLRVLARHASPLARIASDHLPLVAGLLV